MNSLAKIYLVKILGTVMLWCIPLLFFPVALFSQFGIQAVNPFLFRLLGWAYCVLCLGYYLGLSGELKGVRNVPILWMGVMSNVGASVILFYYQIIEKAFDHHSILNSYMLVSALGTSAISLGLIYFGLIKKA
jgi:hypothetical protein